MSHRSPVSTRNLGRNTHRVEPMLPFDITLATFLVPNLTDQLSTVDVIATRTWQLQRRKDDLVAICTNVLKSCFKSICQFEHQFEKMICNHNFGPGAFILVQNSSVKTDLGRKAKPCYLGPMVIIHHSQNGAYHLAELDGTVSNLCFATFRLVPYHSCLRSSIPVMRLVDQDNLARANTDEDIT